MDQSLTTYKRIWKISLPIIIGLVAQNIMMVIDTAFLGRVSDVTLGAAAIGGVFYLSLVMLGAGFSIGVQIMIARRNGQKNYQEIGKVFNLSFYILLCIALIIFILFYFFTQPFLASILKSETIMAESITYIKYRKYGLFFGFLVFAFNSVYVGTTQTGILTLATFIMALFNILFDYILIFGNWGFPEMGIAGAAMATNIAEFFSFFFYVIWMIMKNDHKKYNIFQTYKPDLILLKPLMNLAYPVMFQYFISFSGWFVFFLIIEKLGETALAVSNISRSIYMVLMIPVWGLSSATNTLVSNTIGRGEKDQVMPLIKRILVIGIVINLVLVQFILWMPDPISTIYTENPVLIKEARPILKVISIAMIAFSTAMILFNGLSGAGKTMLALKIDIVSVLIYLISAFLLVSFTSASAPAVWVAEVIYFSCIAFFSYLALQSGSWKKLTI